MLVSVVLYYVFSGLLSVASLAYIGLITWMYIKSDKKKRGSILYFLLASGMMIGIVPTLMNLISPVHTELTSLQLMTQQGILMMLLLFFLCIKFGLILFGVKNLRVSKE